MAEEFKSWGVNIYNNGVRYSKGLNCPQCGWDWWDELPEESGKYIVGFSINPLFLSFSTDHMVGALIIECPRCFPKFWFHVAEYMKLMITLLIERYKKQRPK